jgi:hypothetical protein
MRRSRADTRVVAALLALALCAGSPRARAQTPPTLKPEAQAHLDRGLRLYQSKEYLDAAAEIEAAYGLDPHPDLMYMWAQTRRLAGDCAGAIPLYRRYLDTRPSAKQSELAQRNLVRCEAVVAAASPTAAPAPAPPPPPIELRAPPPPPPAPRPPWYRDTVGHVVTGSGLVMLGTSSALEYWARVGLQDAYDAEIYGDAAVNAEAARVRHRLAMGALVLGSALVVAGVVRYWLHSR